MTDELWESDELNMEEDPYYEGEETTLEVQTRKKRDTGRKQAHNADSYEEESTAILAVKLLVKLAVIAAIVIVVLVFVLGVSVAHENTMYPAVRDGDLCLWLKTGAYTRSDIVLYEVNDSLHMGRIVAEAGQNVQIDETGLTVDQSPASEKVFYPTTAEGSILTYPITVPEECFFVLNDFRNDNNDSRIYDAIPRKNLKGRLIFLCRRRGF